jgi:hypothetical protein
VVAQLVERELPKLEVAGSRPVRRLQGWADVHTIQLGVPSESSLDSWADRLAAKDEDPAHLCEELRLPVQHEPLRPQLERYLTLLTDPRAAARQEA